MVIGQSLMRSLLAAGLIACASNAAVAQEQNTPKPAAAEAEADNAAAPADDGSVVVCEEQANTGSKIRRRSCHRETEAMRQEKQQQIDARHQSSVANTTKGN